MHNQAHISAIAAVAVSNHAFLLQNGIGSALSDLVDHLGQINQTLYRSYGDAVIQGNYDRISTISVHYALDSHSLAYLAQIHQPTYANMYHGSTYHI
jgi:hypothetical protein